MKSVPRYLVSAVALCASALVGALTYPAKSILMIMPLQTGSSIDTGMRIVTPEIRHG